MTDNTPLTTVEVFADSARGVYIPQHFVESRSDGWTGVTQEDDAILRAGPDHEHYWEAWDAVLDGAEYRVAGTETPWRLHHDGDLFAVNDGLMTDEEYENFFGAPRT